MLITSKSTTIVSYEVHSSFLTRKHTILAHSISSTANSRKVTQSSGKLSIQIVADFLDDEIKEYFIRYESLERLSFFVENEEKDLVELSDYYVEIIRKAIDFISANSFDGLSNFNLEEVDGISQASLIMNNLKFNGFYGI